VRQLHLLEEKWPVMERIIQMHTQAVFADGIPNKTRDSAERLWSCIDPELFWRECGEGKWHLKPHPTSNIMELTLSDSLEDRANGTRNSKSTLRNEFIHHGSVITEADRTYTTCRTH
jgi:hypothetical protein